MKTSINQQGRLRVQSENETESYALEAWAKATPEPAVFMERGVGQWQTVLGFGPATEPKVANKAGDNVE